jgi:hypothetical protein
MALAMVSESKTISSLEDPGQNAQSVKRWYKPIVARLLEMHHWGLATKRAVLVEVTNTRGNEWLYAYAAPDDMAFPVSMALLNGTSSVSYYRGLSGLIAMAYGKPIFQYHNGVIFTNVAGELEYTSFAISETDFTASFVDIVVLMLASRLALELPKDYKLSEALAKDATTKINLAITTNLNTGGQRYGGTPSESELVRETTLGSSWDYFPLGPSA